MPRIPFFQCSRRDVLAGAAATLGGAVFGARRAEARAPATLQLGDGTVTVVSDGGLTLPFSFLLPDRAGDEITALLQPHGLPADAVTPDCNLTLFRLGGRLVLFDAGAGPLFQDTAGKILDSLGTVGVDPSDITDVVFTHAHPDHIWGLIDDFEELVFGDAAYWISEAEWDFWQADGTLEAMPEARQSFVVGARNRFDTIEDQIMFFKPGDEILPGIEAVDSSGHTPGHTSFMLHGGGESALVTGDAMTHPVISFERPDWQIGTDQDQEKGVQTRMALLDRLEADQTAMIGFHMPYPGIGTVERAGDAYRFMPA